MSIIKKILGTASLTMLLFVFQSNHCLPVDQTNVTDPNTESIDASFVNKDIQNERDIDRRGYSEEKIYEISQACLTPTNKEGQCKQIGECVLDDVRSNTSQFFNNMCILNRTQIGICCPNKSLSTSSLSLVESLAGPLPSIASFYSEKENNPDIDDRKARGHRGCGTNTKSGTRIVGGRPADPREWPWMAALLRKDAIQYCGGVLITDRHVLTAAHCVQKFKPRDILIRLGEYDFTKSNETRALDFAVTEIRIHRDFDSATYENDIAIIKIQRPTTFNSYIWPICLPPIDQTFEKKTAIVTGWGTQYYGGPASTILMEVTVPIWPQEMCIKSFTQRITKATMCAGAYKGGRDACQGDSGGPLVHQLGNGRWVNVGIVSWGIRCGEPGHPGIYTRVNFYLDWIFANAVF
ncbi:venom protease isoform X1 [Vespula maculifrons]|uniref:Phenoloxidase-activating factor 2 n=1 Tax=Vespula maculifrons TaxID=7453 RepID=A0ABD2CFA9_VESMC|nr:venom protease isoform X1 [Vespula vulgaris]